MKNFANKCEKMFEKMFDGIEKTYTFIKSPDYFAKIVVAEEIGWENEINLS